MLVLSWKGIGLRFIFAALLVFGTYNPSGYAYLNWAYQMFPSYNAYTLLLGVLLLIGWVVYVRASLRSLGLLGGVLAAALFAAIIWVLVDSGLISLTSPSKIMYLILLALSCVLGTGICWSHIRRRLSGQADVDELEDP